MSSPEQGQLPWTMPEWMEAYRNLIMIPSIGKSVEDVMTTRVYSKSSDYQVMCAVEVISQVRLLYRLHREGMLHTLPEKEDSHG